MFRYFKEYVSETAYYAHEISDSRFSRNEKYLRIDSFDYRILK